MDASGAKHIGSPAPSHAFGQIRLLYRYARPGDPARRPESLQLLTLIVYDASLASDERIQRQSKAVQQRGLFSSG
jgi:hypothetical protein